MYENNWEKDAQNCMYYSSLQVKSIHLRICTYNDSMKEKAGYSNDCGKINNNNEPNIVVY